MNETVDCLADMNVKIIANVKMVTVQNRIALNWVLAPKKREPVLLLGLSIVLIAQTNQNKLKKKKELTFIIIVQMMEYIS